MLVLIIISAFLILLLLTTVFFFIVAFVRRNVHDIEDIDSKQNDFLDEYRPIIREEIPFIKNTPFEWVYCFSFDKLKLYGRYYDNHSTTTIILFHGYRSSAARDFSCAIRMYYTMGYNVLLVDQRSHGRSQGVLITFGVKERYDVLSWVDFLINRYGNSHKIILGGMSMGATTVLLAAGLDLPQNVKAIIADCGFSSPKAIMQKVARNSFKIKAFLILPCMDLLCRIFGRFTIYGISTEDALKKTKIPILFIHGDSDNFVPCEMSKKAYSSAGGVKELLIISGAGHGMSYLCDSLKVKAKIESFLNNI